MPFNQFFRTNYNIVASARKASLTLLLMIFLFICVVLYKVSITGLIMLIVPFIYMIKVTYLDNPLGKSDSAKGPFKPEISGGKIHMHKSSMHADIEFQDCYKLFTEHYPKFSTLYNRITLHEEEKERIKVTYSLQSNKEYNVLRYVFFRPSFIVLGEFKESGALSQIVTFEQTYNDDSEEKTRVTEYLNLNELSKFGDSDLKKSLETLANYEYFLTDYVNFITVYNVEEATKSRKKSKQKKSENREKLVAQPSIESVNEDKGIEEVPATQVKEDLEGDGRIEEAKAAEEQQKPELSPEAQGYMDTFNLKKQEFEEKYKNLDFKLWEEKKGYKLFYSDDKEGRRTIKSNTTINRNIRKVYDWLLDINNTSKYDNQFHSGYEIKSFSENLSLQYLKYKGKMGVSPRDFTVIIYNEVNAKEGLIFAVSYDNPQENSKEKNVRADLKFGVMYLTAEDEENTFIEFYSLSDLKLSQWIVNTTLKELALNVRNIRTWIEKEVPK